MKKLQKTHPKVYLRYKADLPKLREAKKIVERIRFDNLFVSASAEKAKGTFEKPAFEKKGGKGPMKPTFENGCLSVKNVKGPMADMSTKADADGDGCVTEAEFDTFMKEHKPSGNPPKRPDEE